MYSAQTRGELGQGAERDESADESGEARTAYTPEIGAAAGAMALGGGFDHPYENGGYERTYDFYGEVFFDMDWSPPRETYL